MKRVATIRRDDLTRRVRYAHAARIIREKEETTDAFFRMCVRACVRSYVRECVRTRQRTLSSVRVYKSIAYATRRGRALREQQRYNVYEFLSQGLRDIVRDIGG